MITIQCLNYCPGLVNRDAVRTHNARAYMCPWCVCVCVYIYIPSRLVLFVRRTLSAQWFVPPPAFDSISFIIILLLLLSSCSKNLSVKIIINGAQASVKRMVRI